MKKLLIVDDEVVVTRSLSSLFDKNQVQVLTAVNGQEGLKLALQEHPDLILLDILMPVMDGVSMLKKLRQDAWGKKAKVLVLSNLSDGQVVDEAIKQGTYEYLVKIDWHINDVVRKIKDNLGL